MNVLSNFLRAQRDEIVQSFNQRLRAAVEPTGLSESELEDHLADFLAEVAAAVERSEPASSRIVSRSHIAQAHGRQRARVGFDLNALAREYALLRDCLYERMELVQLTPTLGELRALSNILSAAVAESVLQYVDEQKRSDDSRRFELLGLFQQAPGFVFFLRGPDLVFDLANPAYHQIVGHREIIGKPIREALPEIAGQGYLELLQRVFREGEPFVGRAMRVELQREPGAPLTEAFIDFVYQPIRGPDGIVTGILGQGYDVTPVIREQAQRRLAESALRKSEERYRSLFESIDHGFCLMQMIVDAEGRTVDYRFLEANASFEAHTGLKNAIGRTARELVPELAPHWCEIYGRVATTGEPARFENHDPAMGRWFDVSANRVGSPELRQVALVFKDISANKRIEQEREHLLESERIARQEAEEASRLKDEFLATVSHELRTPLNAMLGWAHLLRIGSLSDEKRERGLETIERNVRVEAQLVDDLLDVSRILAGKLRLSVEPVDMSRLVEDAIETMRPAADAKSLELQSTLSSRALVIGDPYRLQQVVGNLLSNAVKFTPVGGRVSVCVARANDEVNISVVDTGQGIAEHFLPHVFERFRQEDAGRSRVHGGLGLGLSIVGQLVELHGGRVSAFSAGEGRGATFTVRLPTAGVERVAASTRPPPPERMLPTRTSYPRQLDGLQVLLVDDEEDAREMVSAILTERGARVRVADSAEDGLRQFIEAPPALFICDIGMPGEDGCTLIHKVRRLSKAGSQVPALALTADARAEDRRRALSSGFSDHLAKPVEPERLIAVVASLSQGSERRDLGPV